MWAIHSDARGLRPTRGGSAPDATSGVLLTDTTSTSGAALAGGFIRPFRREDIPGVVTLRRHAFRLSEQDTVSDLADYFDVTFFGSPWSDPAFPSWVFEDGHGALGGFVGVLPRPVVWRGRPIVAAVATQLMVAPGLRGTVGVRLARAFFSGSQDLSLSDTANDAAHRLWVALGGVASPGRRGAWRRRLDGVRGPGREWPPAGTFTETLDPALLLPCMIDVLASYRVAPSYDLRSLGWLLGMAAGKRQYGRLAGGVVRDVEGAAVGWLLYYQGGADRRAELLQMGSIPGARGLLLEHLMWQAWRHGARQVSGRVDPAFRSALALAQCEFTATGPWVLVKADDPRLLADLEPGGDDTFLSRLEGEWWLAF